MTAAVELEHVIARPRIDRRAAVIGLYGDGCLHHGFGFHINPLRTDRDILILGYFLFNLFKYILQSGLFLVIHLIPTGFESFDVGISILLIIRAFGHPLTRVVSRYRYPLINVLLYLPGCCKCLPLVNGLLDLNRLGNVAHFNFGIARVVDDRVVAVAAKD